VVLAGWALCAMLLVLPLFPDLPQSRRGWALLLLLGPPYAFLVDWVTGLFLGAKAGARISSSRFSVGRIAVLLFAMLVLLAPFWWLLRESLGVPAGQ